MNEIRIVAEIDIKPGQKQTLMPILEKLVAGSRAEAGNILYDLTENLENPDHLFVIERWASEQAIAEHNATPHFQAFVAAIEGKVNKLVITKLKDMF